MNKRTLKSYSKMFEDTSKEKIIEMNYELSKKLCEIEEFIDKEIQIIERTKKIAYNDKLESAYEGMEAVYKALKNMFFGENK